MKLNISKRIFLIFIFLFILGCAYYNTFFNAKQYFNTARKIEENNTNEQLPIEAKNKYNAAIDKCWKLINVYGDSSKYADDALLMIGKCHYFLQDYMRAERILNQFLLKYPKSKLIPEAKLWLARTYVELDKQQEAIDILQEAMDNKLPVEMAGEIFQIRGKLYYQKKDYDLALENLQKAADMASSENELGNILFLIGEIYLQLEAYENAIAVFDRLRKLDIPAAREYKTLAEKIEALIQLERFGDAELELKKMLASLRFNKYYSIIETRLANLYEIQGETELALEYYHDIIKKYPNDEGASLSHFYLGQLFEYKFGKYDSAKAHYDKVKEISDFPDVKKAAKERSDLLAQYLKLRDQIRKDQKDIWKLEHGDSTLIDSVIVGKDTVEVMAFSDEKPGNQQPSMEISPDSLAPFKDFKEQDSLKAAFLPADSLKPVQKIKKEISKKAAVSRTPEEVRNSYKKNSFALGEFFLLIYQNFDSATVAYTNFVHNFDDSVLVPKAYYALYYIYHNLKKDSFLADSLRQFVIKTFPNTIYARHLLGRKLESEENLSKNDFSRGLYHQAEAFLDKKDYNQALRIFRKIAESDSGSIWAQKARYAMAYIYEKYLNDINKAIEQYTLVVHEYPESNFAQIARKKIAPPPAESVLEPPNVESAKGEDPSHTGEKLRLKNNTKSETTPDSSLQRNDLEP